MKFVFTDKKVTMPAKVHAYAEKKVGKLDRYFKSEADASITFSVEKDRNVCEVTVRAGSMIFRASESTSDMFASIDSAVATLERQIRKNKTRLAKRLREDAFERTVDEVSTFVPDPEEEDFEILRTKKFPMKPMTAEEAVLQMNLLEHSFFAFRNEDSDGAFAVVYKRKDGGYGLIEDAQ
jgi:putative sigma-54 modulation protein